MPSSPPPATPSARPRPRADRTDRTDRGQESVKQTQRLPLSSVPISTSRIPSVGANDAARCSTVAFNRCVAATTSDRSRTGNEPQVALVDRRRWRLVLRPCSSVDRGSAWVVKRLLLRAWPPRPCHCRRLVFWNPRTGGPARLEHLMCVGRVVMDSEGVIHLQTNWFAASGSQPRLRARKTGFVRLNALTSWSASRL